MLALNKAAKTTAIVIEFGRSYVLSNRFSNCDTKNKRPDKIGNSGYDQCGSRGHGPGGDHGGHNVGAVLKSVQEIKNHGKTDQDNNQ